MSVLKKILMVDDDADLREALADQLVMTEEFDVFEAGDGEGGVGGGQERTSASRCSAASATATSVREPSHVRPATRKSFVARVSVMPTTRSPERPARRARWSRSPSESAVGRCSPR